MTCNENYYEFLGVHKDASSQEIKASYKKLALKYHPDKNNGNDAQFKKLTWIYTVLTDVDKKQKYDKDLLNKEKQDYWDQEYKNHTTVFRNILEEIAAAHNTDLYTFIQNNVSSLFSFKYNSRKDIKNRPQQKNNEAIAHPEDIVITLRASLRDIYQKRQIKMSTKCKKYKSDYWKYNKICILCNGNGYLNDTLGQKSTCKNCDGNNKNLKKYTVETIELNICLWQKRQKFYKCGNENALGEKGNIVVNVKPKEMGNYKISNNGDLIVPCCINFMDIYNGKQVEVFGKYYTIIDENGQLINFYRGCGIPIEEGQERTDLLFNISFTNSKKNFFGIFQVKSSEMMTMKKLDNKSLCGKSENLLLNSRH